jgi:hypothetical protein
VSEWTKVLNDDTFIAYILFKDANREGLAAEFCKPATEAEFKESKIERMIQASDLRIGNWLKREAQPEGFLVDAGTISRISHSGVRDEEPIPLTEEWLKKFGAEKINHIHGYSFWTFSKSKLNKIHIDIYERHTDYYGHQVKHCAYVHELMNLYHALTGSELEVKL